MKGEIHPSLRSYINCFLTTPPFPRMFPRLGGYQDQDPILMRDFRIIAKHEREWKEAQEKSGGSAESVSSEHADKLSGVESADQTIGGGRPAPSSLQDAMNGFLQEMGLEDEARF